jgi:hypothetical protein
VIVVVTATATAAATVDAKPRYRGPMARCAQCHPAEVESFLGHGMSRSLGQAGTVASGRVANPSSRRHYEILDDARGPLLVTTLADGGVRRQRIVGRIGAGRVDTSWVTAEVDGGGETTDRLFFAPVETVTGAGLVLSPFESHPRAPGPDMPLTGSCLACHTTDRVPPVFPPNRLGADAFERLSPLTCSACHGDAARHVDLMSASASGTPGELGLVRLAALTPARQRDVCGRCHLQGDARFDLVQGRPHPERPLAGQMPAFVPRHPGPDFRFVGQLERLALSACFKATPAMTCTTCHRPHSGVDAQGVASFDQACGRCHSVARGHTTLTVREVTGRAARSAAGCVDCHVRRSQPFDLPHVRSADHFIQRRPPAARDDLPHRPFADAKGDLVLFDDGRLSPSLQTPGGRRWLSGTLAMALMTLGRFDEAARRFADWEAPAPPSSAADGSVLPPLESQPAFHTLRALVAMSRGEFAAADAAYAATLALDPRDAEARLDRARMHFDGGDLAGALIDTQAVIEAWPAAEHPWDLRAEIAERAGRPDLAIAALEASTRLWPSNARAWAALARLRRTRGDARGADAALARARTLSPSSASPPSP